jgi:hypothetical protein
LKTRELIRLLEQADPSGDLECCFQNHDINFIDVVPASHDGALELLHRSDTDKRIVSGTITTSGKKVRIHPLSIEDILYDQPKFDIAIDAHDELLQVRLASKLEAWRSKANE